MCYFVLVAMITIQGLLLAKNWNKRNSKTKCCILTILGSILYEYIAHKTIGRDFWYGSHGNRQPINYETLQHDSNLKIDIKNWVLGFLALCILSIYAHFQGHTFFVLHFAVLRYRQKHFRNIKIGKKITNWYSIWKIAFSFIKEYEFRHIWGHFGKKCI